METNRTKNFNRVKKINELTKPGDWRHISGHLNPAELVGSKWWGGPDWLKLSEEYWPQSEIDCDETVVMAEKRSCSISCSSISRNGITDISSLL